MSFVPWNIYYKRRNVSARTFWSEKEFLTEQLKKAKGLPQAHYLLKTAANPALFVRAPYVSDTFIGNNMRQKALARVYAGPGYRRRDEIVQEEQKLLAAAPVEPVVEVKEPLSEVKLRPPYKKKPKKKP